MVPIGSTGPNTDEADRRQAIVDPVAADPPAPAVPDESIRRVVAILAAITGIAIALYVSGYPAPGFERTYLLEARSYKMAGRRAAQEDYIAVREFTTDSVEWLVIGVFDGHGGDAVSKKLPNAVSSYLWENVTSEMDAAEISKLLSDTMVAMGQRFADSQYDSVGSTGVVALVRYDDKTDVAQAWFANVGDSRGLLLDLSADTVIHATKDHKPDDPQERARIEALGGFVTEADGYSVARAQGVLALSRAFGDAKYTPFVSFTPDVTGPFVVGPDNAIVLASDGLFDVLTSWQVAERVAVMRSWEMSAEEIAQRLCAEAYDIGSTDNISVVAGITRAVYKRKV